MTKKSIIISESAHKELSRLSNEFSTPYGKMVECMINYFKKTGQDPRMKSHKSLNDMVKILDKRIVSFFKTQEKDILIPFRLEAYNYSQSNEKMILELSNSIKKAFIKSNEKHEKEFRKILEELEKKNAS